MRKGLRRWRHLQEQRRQRSSMKKSVVIIGASGHGKVIADIVKRNGDTIVGFLDDAPNRPDSFIGYPILGTTDEYHSISDAQYIIAIGNAQIREKIANKLNGVSWYTAIHPSAVISDIDVVIGDGTVVMANAVINPGTSIGCHCIVNTGAIVEHDNRIEDYVHISVGTKLAGTVTIGKSTWVGIGAVVSNNISICENCTIGAGAVVIRDIPASGTYVGVPAKKL